MKHLNDDRLSALRDGALEGDARREAEAHLEACPSCREAYAGLAAADEALARALDHDPGEAYFDAFAGRVQQRLSAERRAAATPAGWWQRLASPRGLAWAGSVAALLVVGIVTYESRQIQSPMANRALAGRAEQQAAPVSPEPEGSQPGPTVQREPVTPPMASRGGPSSDLDRRERGDAFRARAVAPTSDAVGGGAASNAKLQDEASRDRVEPSPSTVPEAAQSAPAPPAASSELSRREAGAQRQMAAKRTTGGEEVAAKAEKPSYAPEPSRAPGTPEDRKQPKTASALDALKERLAKPLDKTDDRATSQGFAAEPQARGERANTLALQEAPAFTWPPALRGGVERAEAVDRLAFKAHSAALKDSAAGLWTRVVLRAEPRSGSDLEARVRVANARIEAWNLEPNAVRRVAAAEAIQRVLELEPPGPRRDAFVKRLAEVK